MLATFGDNIQHLISRREKSCPANPGMEAGRTSPTTTPSWTIRQTRTTKTKRTRAKFAPDDDAPDRLAATTTVTPASRRPSSFIGPSRPTARIATSVPTDRTEPSCAGPDSPANSPAPPGHGRLPYSAADPAALAEPSPAFCAAGLHPYDQSRAILIGLSTALVAAIAVIVALMVNLSWHRDVAFSRPSRTASSSRPLDVGPAEREGCRVLGGPAGPRGPVGRRSGRPEPTPGPEQGQADLALQDELRRHQAATQQTQEESQRLLVRHAYPPGQEAWDRGDTNEVLRLLEADRTDPARQKLCSFAWYYLWRAAHNGGSNTLRGHSDVVRQAGHARWLADRDLRRRRPVDRWGCGRGAEVGDRGPGVKRAVASAGVIIEDEWARRAGGRQSPATAAWAAAYGRNL